MPIIYSEIKFPLVIAIVFLYNTVAWSQSTTVLTEIQMISDIDSSMPGSPGDTYNNDDTIVTFNLNTNIATTSNDLGTLDQAGIDGYHNAGDVCGDSIYSLDTTSLISGIAMRSSDVFTASGIKILNASSAGIPDGVNIDAISRDPLNCDLLISIDVASILSGIAFKTDDIIRFDGSVFSLYQATGLNVNIDALHVLSLDRILVSIDVGTALPDVDALDEEVIEINTGITPFQLLNFEPTQFNTSWQAADLNALWALPKPIEDFMFANGFE